VRVLWFFVSLYAWLGVVFFRRHYWSGLFLFLCAASAFRYYVGSDFDDYVFLFNDSVAGKDVPVEISYPLLARALVFLGFNFQAQFFFYAILTFLFLYKGMLEVSRDKEFLGVAFFFTYIVFYFPSLSIMRQALAAAIAYYACYRFLYKGNILGYLAMIAIAVFFHLSGVIYLLCIVFYYFKPPKFVYCLLIVAAVILGVTVFSELLGIVADFVGFSYKGYNFYSIPIRSPVFYVFTVLLVCVFLYALMVAGEEDYFVINIVFFILVVRLLAIDYKPLNRLGASFSIFLPIFLYQVFFSRLREISKVIVFCVAAPLLLASDFFRANKDYSYYQYSFNVCIYGTPCPVSVVGDLPLEDLLIREELR
jgi:hypothetical protein